MPFKCIENLEKKDIPFIYTPFAQGAILEAIDPHWEGECELLANEWMYKKISAANIEEVNSYRIDLRYLPHPIIKGEIDIVTVQENLSTCYVHESESQLSIDKKENAKKFEAIDNLLAVIGSKPYHYGIIAVSANVCGVVKGHALGFVKRGNSISFYDANNGEITFKNFADFCDWFREEATVGVLKYIINDIDRDPRESLADLYSATPSDAYVIEEEFKDIEFQKQMTDKRNKGYERASQIFDYKVKPYAIEAWSGDTYINPSEHEGYFAIIKSKCALFIAREAPKEGSFITKQILAQHSQACVVAGDEVYIIKKNDNQFEIKKLELSVDDVQKLKIEFGIDKVRLSASDKFKYRTTLNLNNLLFIEKLSSHNFTNKPIQESKNDDNSKEEIKDKALITNNLFPPKNINSDLMMIIFSTIQEADLEELKKLLDKLPPDFNINAKINGMTVLHQAAIYGTQEIIQLLVDRGADVSITDNTGETPLDYARTNDREDLTPFLVVTNINFSKIRNFQ